MTSRVAVIDAFRQALLEDEFTISFEYILPAGVAELEAAAAPGMELAARLRGDGRVHTMSVHDRVRSDADHDPVPVAARVAQALGRVPVLTLSGKGRLPGDFRSAARRALDLGLTTVLLVTGDRLKGAPPDRRDPHMDSAAAVAELRAMAPDALIAAGVSPFKYREEELLGQYLKMAVKRRAGASVFITQVGWDMDKYQELVWYRDGRGWRMPLIANLMFIRLGGARFIAKGNVPGVVVTDDMVAKLAEEATAPDKGKASAWRRLALQIVGVRRLGYAGVQVGGVDKYDDIEALLDHVQDLERELPDLGSWREAWDRLERFADGRPVAHAPGGALYLFPGERRPAFGSLAGPPDPGHAEAGAQERRLYRRLAAVHRWLFEPGSLGFTLAGPIVRGLGASERVQAALVALERRAKETAVGCVLCGTCRLPYTFYVCPERCPKGMSNGPCGGSRDNTCEVGDRECVHVARYRIAKHIGQVARLEQQLLPALEPSRGRSSWLPHFRGDGVRSAPLPDAESRLDPANRHAEQSRP